MPSILNTSLSGMLALQRALDVTGHNIANANTPGYSRQIANFTSRAGSVSGSGFIGSGTRIASIERIYSALQAEQLWTSTTSYSRLNTVSDLTGRIDLLLADRETGLNASLQSFFNTLQDLSNDPSSIPTRQALIGAAEGLAARFQSLDDRLDELDSEVNQRIQLSVAEINRLANLLADVNRNISVTQGSGNSPNDLLDERDRLVLQLSAEASVTTNIQDDGTMSVYIGAGQSLVLGSQARQLGVSGSEFDKTRLTVSYLGSAGNTPLDTKSTGGNLGGLLEYRVRVLDPARQSLGQTAIALAASLNQQHAAGLDLRGNLGGDLFSVATPIVLPSGNNSGSGTAAVSITNIAGLTGADYVLDFDGASYSLTRADNGANIALGGSGTALDPFVADGMSIVVAGVPAAGDQLLLRSGHAAAGSFRSVLSDPQSIAMAAPTRSSTSFGNTGNATISAATIVDASDPGLLNIAIIQFTGPATFSVNGAGSFAYTGGTPIVINGSSVTINGTPAVGDVFAIEANFGASGDNSNGLLIAGMQSLGILDGGSISINENYRRLVSNIGATAHQAQSNLSAQGVVLQNAENAVLTTSAVNLDEEAANLIRFQQAYQAVAQVISVANTLFDTLLNATRR